MPRRNSKHLTDPGITKIGKAPKGKRVERFDAGVDGLCLRITDKGTKTWCIYYHFPTETGEMKHHRLTLGLWPTMGVAAARKEAQKRKDQAKAGIDPKATREAERAAAKAEAKVEARNTFGAIAERYIARECPGLSRGVDVESVIRRGLLPPWTDRKMTDLRRSDLTELTDMLVDAGKPMAAHKLHETAKRVFNWALERGDIEASPFAAMKAPVKKKPRQRKLGDQEISALWPIWEKMGYPFGDLQKVLLLTGQRRNEVACMMRGEIDPDKQAWVIPGDRSKNELDHLVPLSDQVFALIASLPKVTEGDYVFSTTGGERPISGFSKAKKRTGKLVREALSEAEGPDDLDHWTLHDLRRTCRTGLSGLKPAIPLEVKEAVLNHAKEGLVRTYDLHDFADEKRDALQRWADHVRDIVAPPPDNVTSLAARSDSS